MALFAARIGIVATIALSLTLPIRARAAHVERIPRSPATAYSYAGSVYDRLFAVLSRPRFVRTVPPAPRDARLRALAAAPYVITDLTPIAANAIEQDPSLGLGFPTAVDDAGHIPYYDDCECAGIENNIAIVINDGGTFSRILYEDESQQGSGEAAPAGVSTNGNIAGEVFTQFGPVDAYRQVIAWSQTGFLYQSGAADKTYALGINDAGVSVGSDTGAKGSFAALFSINARGAVGRELLAPPKNTSWTGVATGINDAGTIVGYALFPGGSGNGRAVRFSKTGNATVLPVAAAGVSSAAQAINAHGDVAGSAGSQAFLYRNNRVTYLPRPPGDEAGNAVAYALDAGDEAVGDIVTSPSSSTAFLYSGGRSYDLDALLPQNSGWQIVHAAGVNDAGQIVGVGYFSGEGGALTGFSMKPAPTADGHSPRFGRSSSRM